MNSFTASTAVLLANGGQKPISQIKVGEKVRTVDPATGKTVDGTVVKTFLTDDTDLTDVTLDTRVGATVLHTTTHHQIYDRTLGEFVDAGTLRPGDQLTTADGSTVTVTAVRSWIGKEWMYDLTVNDTHTFFVGANGDPVLVHNVGCSNRGRRGSPPPLGRNSIKSGTSTSTNIRTGNMLPGEETGRMASIVRSRAFLGNPAGGGFRTLLLRRLRAMCILTRWTFMRRASPLAESWPRLGISMRRGMA